MKTYVLTEEIYIDSVPVENTILYVGPNLKKAELAKQASIARTRGTAESASLWIEIWIDEEYFDTI